MADLIKNITDAEFEAEVLRSTVPVVVDFWAPWCGPCKMMAPIFEAMAKKFTKAKFVKINTDENYQKATELKIQSIPTVMIFKNGKMAEKFVGVQPPAQFEKILFKYA